MLRTRIIPCLQLIGESLVKAEKFGRFEYIGDPVNTVRIFNELEVDELCFLDIRAARECREPHLKILREIAGECFMPLAYGGGIRSIRDARNVISCGFEKVIVNTAAVVRPGLIREIAEEIGSQSLVVSIDVRRDFWRAERIYTFDGRTKHELDPVVWARRIEDLGAGEILLTAMQKEGTWSGYDLDLVSKVSNAVAIPVVANGGAGTLKHLREARDAGASALAVGSLVVYQRKGCGVLVSFPDPVHMRRILGEN